MPAYALARLAGAPSFFDWLYTVHHGISLRQTVETMRAPWEKVKAAATASDRLIDYIEDFARKTLDT